MKKYALAASFILFVSITMYAGIAETQLFHFNDGSNIHIVNASFGGNIKGKVGWYGWALMNNSGWGEVYFGPTYQVVKCLNVGAGIGLQSDENDPLRFNFQAIFTAKNVFALTTWEKSPKSDWWNRSFVNWTPGGFMGKIGIGLLRQTGMGIGPRVQISVSKMNLWIAYPKFQTLLVGVGYVF